MSTAVETTPTDPKKLVYAWCQRADRLRVQGQYGQAEALFKKALALAEQTFAPDALELSALLNNHGRALQIYGPFRSGRAALPPGADHH